MSIVVAPLIVGYPLPLSATDFGPGSDVHTCGFLVEQIQVRRRLNEGDEGWLAPLVRTNPRSGLKSLHSPIWASRPRVRPAIGVEGTAYLSTVNIPAMLLPRLPCAAKLRPAR